MLREFDLWESNSISTAYTAHACSVKEQTRCEGADCGDDRHGPAPGHRFDGVCDKNGCDLQTFRLGDKQFWGPGADFTIDTTKPVTVVTQFITADGTDTGNLSEVRRLYKQGDKIIQTPSLKAGDKQHDSITKDFCQAEVDLFKDKTNFLDKGGMKATGDALEKGMVLALSLWDDHDVNMLWLDPRRRLVWHEELVQPPPVCQPMLRASTAMRMCGTSTLNMVNLIPLSVLPQLLALAHLHLRHLAVQEGRFLIV